MSSATGRLRSPNYPRPYPPNANCRWVIQLADMYHVISIQLRTFFLEEDRNCM